MAEWSLTKILEGLHDEIHQRLEISRKSLSHTVTKGDASENIWLELFNKYLPERYQAEKAHVVDSNGLFSDQMDVVIFDRQYSPFIFKFENSIIVPSESVYAVFEVKQSIDASLIAYAQGKVKSVRQLYRTSLPIPHAGGTYPPKTPFHIYGGILAFESDWNPSLGDPLLKALNKERGCLDLGCIAADGYFAFNGEKNDYDFVPGSKAATIFLFKLISQLQFSGTAPMIDILAYSKWL